MRKSRDGGENEKKKKEENKNGVFSGHYVIASSRPLERCTLMPKKKENNVVLVAINVVTSRPPEHLPTGTPHARAKS